MGWRTPIAGDFLRAGAVAPHLSGGGGLCFHAALRRRSPYPGSGKCMGRIGRRWGPPWSLLRPPSAVRRSPTPITGTGLACVRLASAVSSIVQTSTAVAMYAVNVRVTSGLVRRSAAVGSGLGPPSSGSRGPYGRCSGAATIPDRRGRRVLSRGQRASSGELMAGPWLPGSLLATAPDFGRRTLPCRQDKA